MPRKGGILKDVPDIIRQRLAQLGMAQNEMALRMGRPKKTINEIVQGVSGITWKFAIQQEFVLNYPARFLMDLQNDELMEQARERMKEVDVTFRSKPKPRESTVPVKPDTCYFCRKKADPKEHYCSGCHETICEECSNNPDPPWGNHEPEAHRDPDGPTDLLGDDDDDDDT